MKTEPELRDGCEWADHEDCIIGNEQGIKNLISACHCALQAGEYYGSDLGEYVGVKKLEDNWFEKLDDSRSTKATNAFLGLTIALIVALILVGAHTVIDWFI